MSAWRQTNVVALSKLEAQTQGHAFTVSLPISTNTWKQHSHHLLRLRFSIKPLDWRSPGTKISFGKTKYFRGWKGFLQYSQGENFEQYPAVGNHPLLPAIGHKYLLPWTLHWRMTAGGLCSEGDVAIPSWVHLEQQTKTHQFHYDRWQDRCRAH